MPAVSTTCEIFESLEENGFGLKKFNEDGIVGAPKCGSKCSIEDDINRLFESLNVRSSSSNMGLSREGIDSFRKNPSKRPMRGGAYPASGIGITEPVSLKQALRGLCISQASEMAATKRFSKFGNNLAGSDAVAIRRLYRAVVIEANENGLPPDKGEGSVVEISLVSEGITSHTTDEVQKTQEILCNGNLHNEPFLDPSDEVVLPKEINKDPSPCDLVVPFQTESSGGNSDSNVPNVKCEDSSVPVEAPRDLEVESTLSSRNCAQTRKLHAASVLSRPAVGNRGNRTVFNTQCFLRPVLGKSFIKKKLKQECSAANGSITCLKNLEIDTDVHADFTESSSNLDYERTEDEHPALPSSNRDQSNDVNGNGYNTASGKKCGISTNGSRIKFLVHKADERSRSKEKGEFSQSSKSSIGDFSCSTSGSEMSNLSQSCRSCTRPHMSKDARWEAIRSVQMPSGGLNLRHLKLLKRLGSGDIGIVYLAELTGTDCLFALKVMDLEFLGARKKLARAQTEKDIMQMLDHPFLPTLYAHIHTEKLSCLVMEYCPGGDLHVLRQKQPTKSFSEQAARFYVAEVLLALEYLHMLGVVYRDLKPENILVREDGHIMLSDFDLSLRCSANPTVVTSSLETEPTTKKMSSPCSDSSCVEPFCLNPSFQVPCFTPRLLSIPIKSRKSKSDLASQISPLPQLVVEPTGARSNSFVGTHEYLAPEIIKGEGHGSAVDWWMFGIFLYELLFGKTPFKGSSNDETLANVVSRSLKFPSSPTVSFHARDLIRGLLIKDPENRLGSGKGAAEIKQHPFFEGLNWALIRCATPPELPRSFDVGISRDSSQKDMSKEILQAEMQMGFEVF